MANRPNVLLIMCDQMRGDCLGIDGHPDVKTPYLDTLAADGMLFENAYSACPSCIPARASLFTGRTPAGTGRVGYKDGVAWEYDHMLAQEMRDGGYQTAVVGKMHVHPPRLGCGFEYMRLHDGYIGHCRKANLPYWMHQNVSDDYMRFLKDELGEFADVNGTGVENNSWITHPWAYEERLHPTNWVVDESIRFLETRDRTRPFFLMTSFVRPHPPFDAPQTYFDLYRDMELRAPAVGDWDDAGATERDGMILDSVHGLATPNCVARPWRAITPASRIWTTRSAASSPRWRTMRPTTTPWSCSAPIMARCCSTTACSARFYPMRAPRASPSSSMWAKTSSWRPASASAA